LEDKQKDPFGWNYRDVLNVLQAAARGLRQEPFED